MEIKRQSDGSTLNVSVAGRIDTSTAPDFESGVKPYLDGVTSLVIDFKDVDYISSAGLRVLLILQKAMNKQGEMKLINVDEVIAVIFVVTGFDSIITFDAVFR